MRDDLPRGFLEIAAERNLLVIADEVYRELCFDHAPTASLVLAQSTGTALVRLESMSKTYLMPGWRVGWMRFINREQMEGLIAAVGGLADGRLCAPTPSQYAMKPALTGDHAFRDQFLTELKKRRELCADANQQQGASLSVYSAVRLLHDDQSGRPSLNTTDVALILDLLEETQTLVAPGSGFGADPSESYFRLVYLADESIPARFFDGLDNFISR